MKGFTSIDLLRSDYKDKITRRQYAEVLISELRQGHAFINTYIKATRADEGILRQPVTTLQPDFQNVGDYLATFEEIVEQHLKLISELYEIAISIED